MKLLLVSVATFFAVVSCGDSSKATSSDSPAPKQDEKDKGQGDQKPAPAKSRLAPGKYYITAGNVEAFDSQGNKVDPQNLQVTGDYTWTVAAMGNEKYEVTATGSAKVSTNNEVVAEVNCKGAQDVYVFTLTESNALREFRATQTGCAQGSSVTAAQQQSIEPLNENSFTYTVVNQNNGFRIIESYTFKK